jgi:hypothetical protein
VKAKLLYWGMVAAVAIVAVKVWDKFIAPRLGI